MFQDTAVKMVVLFYVNTGIGNLCVWPKTTSKDLLKVLQNLKYTKSIWVLVLLFEYLEDSSTLNSSCSFIVETNVIQVI